MTDPTTLRALVAELCEAKEGSLELRARIYCATAAVQFVRLLSRGFIYRLGNNEESSKHWTDIPDYCNSLDAALPGEDIDLVARLYDHGPGWRARCRSASGVDGWSEARAHTEPLARRAAALLAMAEKERER